MQDGPCRARPEQGPAPRAELLHVLMLRDFDRAERIGEFWSTHRAVPSPSSLSTARRTGRIGQCLWGCRERRTARDVSWVFDPRILVSRDTSRLLIADLEAVRRAATTPHPNGTD